MESTKRYGILLLVACLPHVIAECPTYDAIVVGLGASGLGALTRLAERGHRVLGLESKSRLGGRVNTQEFGGGLVEIGAEWIHGECDTFELARKNNVSILYKDWTPNFGSEGAANFGSRGVLNETFLAELFQHFMDLHYEGGDSENITVGQFYTEQFYQYVADKPDIVSDEDFCRNFLKLLELVLAFLGATDSWHDISLKGDGYYQQCPGSQGWSWNRCNYFVTKIDWSGEGLVTVTAGANKYRAKAVIVTVYLGVLKYSHASLFEPSIPIGKARAIAALSIGVVDKICLYYEDIWWGEKKTLLFLWNDGLFFELFSEKSAWYSDPDVRGSYSYRGLATDAIPTAVDELGSPLPSATHPRLLFAGEATSDHFATMHGALETGWREADRFHEYHTNKTA